MNELAQDLNEALVMFLGAVTAARAIVVVLQRLAAATATDEDDKVLSRVGAALDLDDRVLDWVSVGPTNRKR